MKKAFTLSEALVSLAIIAVLAAILIPVLDTVRPDKDKIMYKKAMYNMQSAVSTAMDSVTGIATNSAAYWADDKVGNDTFCRQIADTLNTAGRVRCSTSELGGPSNYTNPNFITTDGIRWWGLEGKIFDLSDNKNMERDIHVSRKLDKGVESRMTDSELRSYNGLKIRVRYDGKVHTGDDDSYAKENEILEDSLNVRNTHSTTYYTK